MLNCRKQLSTINHHSWKQFSNWDPKLVICVCPAQISLLNHSPIYQTVITNLHLHAPPQLYRDQICAQHPSSHAAHSIPKLSFYSSLVNPSNPYTQPGILAVPILVFLFTGFSTITNKQLGPVSAVPVSLLTLSSHLCGLNSICNIVSLDYCSSPTPPTSKNMFLIAKVSALFQFFAFYNDSVYSEECSQHF